MQAHRNLDANTSAWTIQPIEDFKESVSYDGNGNIRSYIRNGNNTFAGRPLAMDNLSCNYIPGTNKLSHVIDAVPNENYGSDIDGQEQNNYSYDKIGNLIADQKEGIENIEWNVYGKISRIDQANGKTIRYNYDAAGNRIRKDIGGVYTWYVRSGNGDVMSVYTQNDEKVNNRHLSLIETNLFGSARLGMSKDMIDLEAPSQTEQYLAGNISAKGINPVGNKAQSARFREGVESLVLTWAIGKVMGTTITVFTGPLKHTVKYLFRGTSLGFEGNAASRAAVATSTSSDPVVSTIFAINSKQYGEAVMYVALPKNLKGVEIGVRGNGYEALEKELVVGLVPEEFAKRVTITISAEESRNILKSMGINLPARIRNNEDDSDT